MKRVFVVISFFLQLADRVTPFVMDSLLTAQKREFGLGKEVKVAYTYQMKVLVY